MPQYSITAYNEGLIRVPSGTQKPGKPGDLNIICPGLEIAWNLFQKVRKLGHNKKFSRKPG